MPRQLTCARSWRVAKHETIIILAIVYDVHYVPSTEWDPLIMWSHSALAKTLWAMAQKIRRIWDHLDQLRYMSEKSVVGQSQPQSMKRGKENVPSVIYLLSGWITVSDGILRGNGASSNILSERNQAFPNTIDEPFVIESPIKMVP